MLRLNYLSNDPYEENWSTVAKIERENKLSDLRKSLSRRDTYCGYHGGKAGEKTFSSLQSPDNVRIKASYHGQHMGS